MWDEKQIEECFDICEKCGSKYMLKCFCEATCINIDKELEKLDATYLELDKRDQD